MTSSHRFEEREKKKENTSRHIMINCWKLTQKLKHNHSKAGGILSLKEQQFNL